MNKEKIAVLTDSGSDILENISPDVFVLPLIIQIDDKTYVDGVDINLEQVLDQLDDHKVATSLPKPKVIEQTLDKIKELGYTHVIISTISSGLSGTFNICRMIAEDYEGLTIALIDTKNISKGSGYNVYKALELIDKQLPFDEIVTSLTNTLDKQKVFFTIATVDYLRRGGRIGLVAGTVASVLNIKPIISCNEKGVYYTEKKTRGYLKALNLLIEVAHDFAEIAKSYDVTVLVARVDDKIKAAIEKVKETFKKIRNFEMKTVTPALAIHIGPEAFGVVVRKL